MNEQKLTEQELRIRAACDRVILNGVGIMHGEIRASMEMIIDRLLTYGLSQSAASAGAPGTAAMLREVADRIDNGLLDSVARKEGANH